jgi:hypothetical protein
MKRLAILALSFALTACDSDKKDGAGAPKTLPPNPVGKWEVKSEAGKAYFYTRYEFKDDNTFTRESGTSTGVVMKKISGSWSATAQEAPYYSTGASLTDDMLRGAGIQPKIDRVPGSIVLRYNVKSKSDIEVGATLVAERGPVFEPAKKTFDLEEHRSLALDKTGDRQFLSISKQPFERVNP